MSIHHNSLQSKQNENRSKNKSKNDVNSDDLNKNEVKKGMGRGEWLRVSRLREERELLMRTGVYGEEDDLIVALDEKIRQAMGALKS